MSIKISKFLKTLYSLIIGLFITCFGLLFEDKIMVSVLLFVPPVSLPSLSACFESLARLGWVS